MAKYTIEYEGGNVTHTLFFRGEQFFYTMVPNKEDNGASSEEICIEFQLKDRYPNLSEDALAASGELDMNDEEDIEVALETLTYFELHPEAYD